MVTMVSSVGLGSEASQQELNIRETERTVAENMRQWLVVNDTGQRVPSW